MVKPETPEIQTLTSDLVEKFYENIRNKCLSGYAQKDGDFKKFKYRKYNALDNGRVLKMMIWAGKKKPIFLNVEYQMDFTGCTSCYYDINNWDLYEDGPGSIVCNETA